MCSLLQKIEKLNKENEKLKAENEELIHNNEELKAVEEAFGNGEVADCFFDAENEKLKAENEKLLNYLKNVSALIHFQCKSKHFDFFLEDMKEKNIYDPDED